MSFDSGEGGGAAHDRRTPGVPGSHCVDLPRDPKTREQRRLTLSRSGAGGFASEITNATWATTPVSNKAAGLGACCVPQAGVRDLIRRWSSSHSPSDGPVGTVWEGSPEGGGSGGGLSTRCIVAPRPSLSPCGTVTRMPPTATKNPSSPSSLESKPLSACTCTEISSWLAYTAARRFSTTTAGMWSLVDILTCLSDDTAETGHAGPKLCLGVFAPTWEHDRNDSEHTFAFKGVCKIGTQSAHFGHTFQLSEGRDNATGLAPKSIKDRQRRSKRLRGITTIGERHVMAGKQQRVGNHLAELRSCIAETRVTHHKPELPTSPLTGFDLTQKEGIDARL